MLWFPGKDLLFVGDHIYVNTHLWLASSDFNAQCSWIHALKKLHKLIPEETVIFPVRIFLFFFLNRFRVTAQWEPTPQPLLSGTSITLLMHTSTMHFLAPSTRHRVGCHISTLNSLLHLISLPMEGRHAFHPALCPLVAFAHSMFFFWSLLTAPLEKLVAVNKASRLLFALNTTMRMTVIALKVVVS